MVTLVGVEAVDAVEVVVAIAIVTAHKQRTPKLNFNREEATRQLDRVAVASHSSEKGLSQWRTYSPTKS